MSEVYRFKKSSRSGNEGACVELAHAKKLGVVRDSKNPGGPLLMADISALIAAAKSVPAGH